MTRISKHFSLEEFVDPEYIRLEEAGELLARWYVSKWQVDVAEFLRKRYGVTYINTYAWDDNGRTEAGTRLPTTKTGATFSQHKYMNALDPQFKKVSAEEVRNDCLANMDLFREYGITTIESGEYAPTWFHCDGRDWNDKRIHVIEP